MNKIAELKKIIDESNNIVVFTGAGISVPSGISDFRSSTGLYVEKYDKIYSPEEILSHHFFLQHPDIFYKFYKDKIVHLDAKPNIAHKYFARLEKEGKVKAVVTQNIDGLHQLAGSKNVFEVHGTILKNHCMKCGKFYDVNSIFTGDIPKCSCGGMIKPDVVLYEEQLDYNDIEQSIKYISEADTLIIVGTSLVVQPAASFVSYFKGRNLVVINKSHTSLDNYALTINDDIVNVIKELDEDK